MKLNRLIIFILVIILLGILAIYYPKLTGEAVKDNTNQEYQKEACLVSRVIDGDTLVCGNKTIRLLGINNKCV